MGKIQKVNKGRSIWKLRLKLIFIYLFWLSYIMLGIVYVLLSCFIIAVSVVMQRKFQKGKKFSIKKTIKSKYWLLAFAISLIGGLFYLMAIPLIDISILQPLMNLTTPFVFVISYISLKEKLSRNELIGVVILLIASVMLVVQI